MARVLARARREAQHFVLRGRRSPRVTRCRLPGRRPGSLNALWPRGFVAAPGPSKTPWKRLISRPPSPLWALKGRAFEAAAEALGPWPPCPYTSRLGQWNRGARARASPAALCEQVAQAPKCPISLEIRMFGMDFDGFHTMSLGFHSRSSRGTTLAGFFLKARKGRPLMRNSNWQSTLLSDSHLLQRHLNMASEPRRYGLRHLKSVAERPNSPSGPSPCPGCCPCHQLSPARWTGDDHLQESSK